jgi:hypothetical protein
MTPEQEAFALGYKAGLAEATTHIKDVIETSRMVFHDLQAQIEELNQLLRQARCDMWRMQMIDRALLEERHDVVN